MRLADFGETVKFNLCVKVTFLLCELVQKATLAYSLKTESAASFNMDNLATSQESQINLTLFMYRLRQINIEIVFAKILK